MSRAIGFVAIPLLLLAGCNNTSSSTMSDTPEPAASATAQGTDNANTSPGTIRTEATSSVGTVAITDGKAQLDPSNTHIGWVGTHTGDNPNPRVGSFEKFQGVADVDPAAKTLKSLSVEIDTASLKSPIETLTTHLNSPDFFDTREYPKATFKSTKIADDGTITGNLTLHGVTKEISFPATITVTDAGLAMKADFTINRTDFKLGEGQDRVEKDVQINVTVGEDSSSKMPGADNAASSSNEGGTTP
jgi:polyisoprenoid-binding protein YceI